MKDESQQAVTEAYEEVARVVRELAGRSGVAVEPSDSLYRIAYRLTLEGHLSERHLTAIDHFRRAHAILGELTKPPDPQALAEFNRLARQLLKSLAQVSVAA